MKKIFSLVVLCAVFAAGVPVFAEISKGHESEYYYVNVPIEKIYPYRKGYVVEYRKGGVNGRGRVYLPLEWFSASGAKGEYIPIGSGTAWPYLTVYYKDGEFAHVRLYVRRDMNHETWGNIHQSVNIDDRFENITDIKLEF